MHIGRYIFLGDVVGYGPNPDECVSLLRSLANVQAVLGNHDAAVLWKYSPYRMNLHAQKSLFWTMKQLRQENLNYINGLDYTFEEESTCYCHSMPHQPENWMYLNNKNTALLTFMKTSFATIFISHTHLPLAISQENNWKIKLKRVKAGESVDLVENKRWIINCGSIGQPRDGLTQGSYCLYDDKEKNVLFQRFDYDFESTASKIIHAGLPEYLARRLRYGQ